MSSLVDMIETRAASPLRKVDLDFFAAGGVSPFALTGYRAAPMMTERVATHVDLAFMVRRERVRFLRGGRFVRESESRGELEEVVPAYLIPAIENGVVVDTVAWHPKTFRIASEYRRAALLGTDALTSVMTADPILVARDPREWLAQWRVGVCIVDERLARPLLLEARALQAADLAHGQKLKAMLERVQLPRIGVPASSIGSIAA